MRYQLLPRHSPVISAVRSEFHSGSVPNSSQNVLNRSLGNVEFVSKSFCRRWALSYPGSKINQITVFDRNGDGLFGDNISFRNNMQPFLGIGTVDRTNTSWSFYVVRDDLLHPLANGNKARKLDALLPLLEDYAVTDVVTCGGCQSAHAAAVAVSCAERGIKSHLLLRGEEPEILTGYNLVSKLYGDVIYAPRSLYARREEMLSRHAESVAGHSGSILSLYDILEASFRNQEYEQQSFSQTDPVSCQESSRKVAIINEGAGDAIAILGLMRLIRYLSQDHLFGEKQLVNIVVDAGTGTTAIGLALGTLLFGLPWKVTAIMLADKIDNYRAKEQNLISEFLTSSSCPHSCLSATELKAGIVHWVERSSPRKFGNILEGEVQECRKIAQQTGILVDPVYTLSAWDLATRLSQKSEGDTEVVMLHTGGTLGMFGLAQRYNKSFFRMP